MAGSRTFVVSARPTPKWFSDPGSKPPVFGIVVPAYVDHYGSVVHARSCADVLVMGV
jgi:hypothetical protein